MKSIEQRKQRWLDFYDWNKPVTHVYTIGYPLRVSAPYGRPWPENKELRIAHSAEIYERMCERAEWLNDDTIPHLNPYTGTEIFAEAFGCRVHRPEDNNPFALPMVYTAEEAARVKVPDLVLLTK